MAGGRRDALLAVNGRFTKPRAAYPGVGPQHTTIPTSSWPRLARLGPAIHPSADRRGKEIMDARTACEHDEGKSLFVIAGLRPGDPCLARLRPDERQGMDASHRVRA